METQQIQLEVVVIVVVQNRLQGGLTLELDPPRNHHLFHFTLPHNPSFPSSKNVASHDQQQQQDLFFFGSLDSLPPQHTHVRSPPKNTSLISPPVAVGTPTRPPRKTVASSRLGTRCGRVRGEIIEVKSGHIVRSTGRKDRHSKVCTAKGSRDRRVRLSPPTAIQFYDVQDRLGYDRPSKAVDWLIKKAKAAIDELDHLPSWKPTATAVAFPAAAATNTTATAQQETMIGFHQTAALDHGEDSGLGNMLRQHRQMDEINKQNNDPAACLSFLPSSLDSDTIADTIKSFPMGVSSDQSVATSSSMQFHGYSPDLILRTSSQSQDLCLSLQSFQEQPLMLQPRHPQAHKHSQHQQVVLTGTPPPHHNQLVLDGSLSSLSATSMWLSDHQRISQWNSSVGDAGISTAGGSVGFMFGSLAVAPMSMPMPTSFGQQGQFFQQRGPLQSSNVASVRAWIDPTMAIVTNDHQPGIGFAMGDGYSGYSDILAQIRGQGEEMQDGILNRPSSGSSDSHSRY